MMDGSIDLKCDCGVREALAAVGGKYCREGRRPWRVRQRVDFHSAFEHLHHLAHPRPSRRFLLQAPYTACLIVDYYCWLVWCQRKILFWLKIYDRLRPNEHATEL